MPSGQVHLHMHRRDQAGAQAGQHRCQSQCSVQAHLRKMSQILSGSQNRKFIDKQPYCILLVCKWFTDAVHRFLCRIQPIPGCYRSFITFQDAPQQFEAALLYSQVMHKKMMYSVGSHLYFFAQHSPHSLTTSRQPSLRTMAKFSLNKSTLSIYNLGPHLGLDALMQLTFCALFKSF